EGMDGKEDRQDRQDREDGEDGEEGLEETVAQFARRRFGAEAVEALVEPLVTGIFAGDAARLSMQAAFPRIAELERKHGSLVRGMLASARQQRAARRAEQRAGKREELSLEQLVASTATPRPATIPPVTSRGRRRSTLWAPVAGTGALAKALASALGSRARTNARVTGLEMLPGSAVPARTRVVLADGSSIDADVVALAVPTRTSAALIAPHDARLAELLDGIPYVSAVVVHVGIERKLVAHELNGFGFLVANGEEPRCLGCLMESSLWPRRAPPGSVLLRLIYGGARDPRAIELSDEAMRAIVAADLRLCLGVAVAPSFFHLVRHARALPQYEIGHKQRVAAAEKLAAALGWILAGNAFHGVSANDCVKDALRVADLVEARLVALEASKLAVGNSPRRAVGCSPIPVRKTEQ
ncbi:MAG: protoporphyrinogen oxidase, partial [Pseudomonadota bacterium]